MHWNTAELIRQIEALPGVSDVTSFLSGDDNSDQLVIKFTKDYCLWCTGWPDDPKRSGGMISPGDCEIVHVELSDGLDSRGGLNSFAKSAMESYSLIREFFESKGAHIIDSYREIY